MLRTEEFAKKFLELAQDKKNFVVVTILAHRGSSPQDNGAKMLVTASEFWGTVGGGKVEADCLKKSRQILDQKLAQIVFKKVNLQIDLGMSCGGEVDFLFEPYFIEQRWSVAVFGAGHIAQKLVVLLSGLDCDITVVDSRQEWLDKISDYENLIKVQQARPEQFVGRLKSNCFVVVMTMGHATDLPILKECLKLNLPFLGVIGSELKGQKIRQELLQEYRSAGATEEEVDRIERIFCPLGEKWGNNSPQEIALSIVAQLIKERDRKFECQS